MFVVIRETHLPVVAEGLVESGVVFVGDFLRLSHPDGLLLVKVSPLVGNLARNTQKSDMTNEIMDMNRSPFRKTFSEYFSSVPP